MAPVVGPRTMGAFSQLVGEAVTHAIAASADGVHDTRQRYQTAFYEQLEREMAPLCQQIFGEMAADPETPEMFRAVLQQMVEPTHQFNFILQLLGLIGAVIKAVFTAAAPIERKILNNVWARDSTMPLPPEVAAALAARGFYDFGQAVHDGASNGYSGDKVQALFEGAKHGPGVGEAVALLALGEMDLGGFAQALKDDGIREIYWHELAALANRPLDIGTAVRAAVENHIGLGDLQDLFKKNSVNPAYAALALETAGRPPGVIELTQLVNRGELGLDQLAQAVRESDIKDKYIQAISQLRHHYPPFRSVVAMLAAAAIDRDTAAQWLTFDGVHPSAIDAVIREALNRKHTKVRELSQAQVLMLYRDHEIDRGTATQHLAALHMDAHEVDVLLAHEDFQREHALQVEAARRVQKHVLAHLVDDQTALQELRGLGMVDEQAQLALHVWQLERDQQVATLTPAQVSALAKRGRIDRPEFDRRLRAHGYSDVDLGHLWFLATGH